MPKVQIKGLRELKGFNSLSDREYAQWKRDNSKYLGKYSTYQQEEELYNTQRFVKSYGKDTARKMSYSQRLAVEKHDLDEYNNSIIRKAFNDTYNPLRADGTVDPKKGMGNLELFYKYGLMEPQFQKELLESGWRTGPEIDAYVKEKKDKNFAMYSAGTEAGADGAFSYFSWGRDAEEKIDRGGNQNIVDKIYAKDMAAKAKKSEQATNQAYEELKQSLPKDQVRSAFINEINPVQGKNAGIPQLAAFYDRNGNILSSEVKGLSIDDMRRWIAKKRVYESQYEIGTAYDMLDKEAKDYIDEHQDWMEYTAALSKDMAIGATAYTMDKINGVRAAYIQLAEGQDKVPAFMDKDGHYWGREHVKDGIYTDPYTNEKIPVKEVMAQPSALDAQGIATDGTTRGAFFNNRYWSDAESTGMFDRKDQARAKELNGYSPSKAVYKVGEDKDYVWEVAKMAQFALADGLSNLVPSLGVWGGTAMMGSKVAQGVSTVGKFTKAVGAATYYTGRAAQAINPTLGAIGIGHAYGRGVFGETLEGNMSMINDKLYKDAENRFSINYNGDTEFKSNVDSQVSQKLNEYISENQDYINQLSDEERTNFLSNLESTVRRDVVQGYINSDVDTAKQGEDYYNAVNEAADAATSAAATAAWTIGLKYALVNNFGYRKFLFKDPLKRANREASKVLQGATEGANKRLSIRQRFANATTPQKLKEVGKITLAQMWGGGWTNFTDELQSAGARRINQDRMGRYLSGDYQAEAEAEMLGGMGTVLSYFAGAGSSLSDESTWSAGLVGALGSVTSFAPNVASMASGRFRSEWAAINADTNLSRAERNMRKLNLMVSNGILNTYYDKVIGEKQAQDAIDKVNHLIDNWDEFKALGRGLAIDMASMDVTNPHDADALNFVKAAQLAHALYRFSNDKTNSELIGVAQRSSLFSEALNTVQKLAPGKKGGAFSRLLERVGINRETNQFTKQDARNYLTEYYARNPQVAQSEENSTAALQVIADNASKLKRGIEVFDTVNKTISKIERDSGREIPIGVKARLVERFALDQFLTDRIADVEEGISGNRSVTANRTVESYGSDKAIGKRIGSIDSIAKSLEREIEKARTDRDKKHKEAEDYIESRDHDLTSDESREYGKLVAKADAADLQLRALDESKRGLSLEKEDLMKMKGAERRVLSSDEILKLSPEDRARMLDDSNFNDYSEAQKEEITRARATLAMRDPQLLDDVQHQALMVQRRRVNSNAYSMMLQNPEAAAAQIDANAESEYRKYKEAVKRRREAFMSSFIKALEEAPSSNTTEFEEVLTRNLMGVGLHPGIEILKELRDSQVNNIKRYSYLFDRAIDKLEMLSDVKDALDGIENLEEAQRVGLNESISRMVNASNTREDLLGNLGRAIDPAVSPDVSSSDRVLLSNVLRSLEEVWSQQSSTTTMTPEEMQAAKDAFQQRQSDDEAARLEAEKKAVEDSLTETTTPEEDKRLSSEKDTVEDSLGRTSKEEDDRLSSERKSIEDNPEVLNDATDVQLESPTLEEQASEQPSKVDIIPAPVDDSTDQGNTLPEVSDTLLGNSMYGYELSPLKYHGKQVPRKGANPNDKMSRYFAWMESAGIKLQDIIDTELSDIMKSNPDVFPMFVKFDKNATNDDAMVDFALLTVEYTQDVADIHNDKNGGVITSDGKQYLVVGTLGFARGNRAQGDMVRSVLKSGQKSWFDAHPSERFFVDTRKHTQIQSITSGRLVRQLATDSEVQIRSISELLTDETRNPKGLTIGDLKWGIQYDNRLATVNVSERNVVYPPSDGASNLGSVFLLIEAANGNYIPAYIRPVRLTELRDGKLKAQLNDLINELTSTDHARRLASIKQLVQFLNLTQEGDNILIGTADKPTVSIVKGGSVIRTFNLADAGFDRTRFLESINELDPRVNITTSTLSDVATLEMFDEAGALTTDLAKIGTSGASYNVYAMDADGNPIITTPVESEAPTLDAGSDLTKAQRKLNSERMGNATYRKDSNGNWYTETDRLVTDPRLVEQLNYRNLIRTRDLKPNKVIGIDEVFIINSDTSNPLVLVRRRGNQMFAMSKEGAVKTINEVNAELAEKARQERLQKELEIEASNDETILNMSEEDRRKAADEGEDVDLGLGETITEEQVVGQITGNFEVEATPQQKTAEELVEKITADTADIQLAEDGATYVDSSGKHYARVTSVIAADEFSDGRFEADNPWGLPSTTIGTGIDEFVRDFFDNKIGNRDNLADRYPNASNEQLQEFAKQLDGLRESFRRRGLTIVPRDVTVTGTVEVRTKSGDRRVLDVAGTLDLLAYDKDGNFYIFDMKTNRSVPRGESGRKKGAKWSKQLTLYKQLLQEKYGAVVKGLEIIPIQVDYPAPKGWGNATTEYSKRGGQLYADGKEYRMAEPVLHDNIPLPETALHIELSKLTPAEQAMVRTLEDVAPTREESDKSAKQKAKAKERLARVEAALESSDVKLWSDSPSDNVTITSTSNGFNSPYKSSRLFRTAKDYRTVLNAKIGDVINGEAKVVYKDRYGNTYIEIQDAEDGNVKSAIVFPISGRGGDNFTVYFYKTLNQDEKDTLISAIKDNPNRKGLIEYVNTLLSHTNDNLLYLSYRNPDKLAKLRAEAYTKPEVPIVQSEPVKTGEDINKTGTKSLAELQSKKTVDTALSIMKSKEFGKRARALLKSKFPDMPSKTAELERFFQSKGIATTGIADVEQWLRMIEECK